MFSPVSTWPYSVHILHRCHRGPGTCSPCSLAVWVCLGRRPRAQKLSTCNGSRGAGRCPGRARRPSGRWRIVLLFGPKRAWVPRRATKRLVAELLKFLPYLSGAHAYLPLPSPSLRRGAVAQTRAFRRPWERGRRRPKSGTDGAVAPRQVEGTPAPPRGANLRWSQEGRGPGARQDERGPGEGSRPRRSASSAPGPRRTPPPDIPFGFDLQPGRGRGTPFPQCSGACRRRRRRRLRCR